MPYIFEQYKYVLEVTMISYELPKQTSIFGSSTKRLNWRGAQI